MLGFAPSIAHKMATHYSRSKKEFSTARGAMADVMNATGLKPWLLKADHTATHYRWRPKNGLNGPPERSKGGGGWWLLAVGALAVAGAVAVSSSGSTAARKTRQSTVRNFLLGRLAGQGITAVEIEQALSQLSDADFELLNQAMQAIEAWEQGAGTTEAVTTAWGAAIARPAFHTPFWRARWKFHNLLIQPKHE